VEFEGCDTGIRGRQTGDHIRPGRREKSRVWWGESGAKLFPRRRTGGGAEPPNEPFAKGKVRRRTPAFWFQAKEQWLTIIHIKRRKDREKGGGVS